MGKWDKREKRHLTKLGDMTKSKNIIDSKRPRREMGEIIRGLLRCPFCEVSDTLRVVAYRENTVRVECGHCKGRFSFEPRQLYQAIEILPGEESKNKAFVKLFANDILKSMTIGQIRDAARKYNLSEEEYLDLLGQYVNIDVVRNETKNE